MDYTKSATDAPSQRARGQDARKLVASTLREGFSELLVSFGHGTHAAGLPLHHRDPFGRMLVAQAQIEGLTLVTRDPAIRRYDVATMPA